MTIFLPCCLHKDAFARLPRGENGSFSFRRRRGAALRKAIASVARRQRGRSARWHIQEAAERGAKRGPCNVAPTLLSTVERHGLGVLR